MRTAPRVLVPARQDHLRRLASDLCAQDAHGARRCVLRPRALPRGVRVLEPARVGARPVRHGSHLDLYRAGARHGLCARPGARDPRRHRGHRGRLAFGRPCVRGPRQRGRPRERPDHHRERQRSFHRGEPRRTLPQPGAASREQGAGAGQLFPHARPGLPLPRRRKRRAGARRRAGGASRHRPPRRAARPHGQGHGLCPRRGRSRRLAPCRPVRPCDRRARAAQTGGSPCELRRAHGIMPRLRHGARSARGRRLRRDPLHHGLHARAPRAGGTAVPRRRHRRRACRDARHRARSRRGEAGARHLRHLPAARLRRAVARSVPERRPRDHLGLRLVGVRNDRPDPSRLLRYRHAGRYARPALPRPDQSRGIRRHAVLVARAARDARSHPGARRQRAGAGRRPGVR